MRKEKGSVMAERVSARDRFPRETKGGRGETKNSVSEPWGIDRLRSNSKVAQSPSRSTRLSTSQKE